MADEVVAEIQKLGRKATAIQLDSSNTKEFPVFVETLTAYLNNEYQNPNFDYLINNAGTGGHTSFANATEDEFDVLVNIHYKGVYFLIQKSPCNGRLKNKSPIVFHR